MKDEREPAREGASEGEPAEETLLELVLAAHEAQEAPVEPARIDGVVVGRIVAIGPEGDARVDFDDNPGPSPLAARAMIALDGDPVGRDVALLFERGDPRRPIVMGLMHARQAPPPAPSVPVGATADGERIVFEAGKEIVLSCGEASITLTRAGKILIKGAYVLSRSSGVNRILGGSVQIN